MLCSLSTLFYPSPPVYIHLYPIDLLAGGDWMMMMMMMGSHMSHTSDSICRTFLIHLCFVWYIPLLQGAAQEEKSVWEQIHVSPVKHTPKKNTTLPSHGSPLLATRRIWNLLTHDPHRTIQQKQCITTGGEFSGRDNFVGNFLSTESGEIFSS